MAGEGVFRLLSDIEVESFFSVCGQTRLFLMSVPLGAAFGVVYDVFRAVRVILPFMGKKLPTAVCDFIFMLICGLGIYFFSLSFARGEVRAYYAIGAALGFVIYYFTVGTLVMGVIREIFGLIYFAVERLAEAIRKKWYQIKHKK